MAPIERLAAGRAAHTLALLVYRTTRTWPKEERYGLAAQVRRAAVSIGANLSEGVTRRGARELRRFVDLARGSHGELQFLLQIAAELGYVADGERQEIQQQLARTGILLWKLYSNTAAAADGL
jgi:four helix bundle protein